MASGLENLPILLVLSGIVLMTLEALAPGANFIVIGTALLGAGLAGVVLNPFLGGGLLVAVLAGLMLAFGGGALYIYREFEFYGDNERGAPTDSNALRGRTGRVTERVTPTGGEVKLEEGGFNPIYQARSIDGEIAEGEEVMVVDPGGGNVLTVEALSAIGQDSIDRALDRDRQSEEDLDIE